MNGVNGTKARRRWLTYARRIVSRSRSLMRVGARPIAAARNIANPDLRRPFPAYVGRLRQLFTAVLLLWLVALVAGVLISWVIPAVVFGAFAGWAVALRVRARPGWLGRRGVPPGSVGVGPEPKLDPDLIMRQIGRHGPLFKSNQFSEPVACVADLDLATRLFRTCADDLGPTPMGFERHIPGGAIRWADRERHTYLSRLFARALSPTPVRSWRDRMERVVNTHLDRMASDPGNAADGIAPLAPIRELVRAAWSELLLGIPFDDPAYAEVCEIVDDLDVYRFDPIPDDETIRRLDRLSELIRGRVGTDADGSGVGAPAEFDRLDPGSLDDPGTIRNLIYTMCTARDDVGGLLMWILKHLTDNPDWAAAVRTATDRDVADRVVSETLRLQQSEFLFRRARRQLTVDGATIPKDWIVRVCIHEIHRDPDKFPDPDDFDPNRFVDGGCGRDVYAPFGIDHHSCVGETLAREFAAVFATVLTQRFDLHPTDDGPIELSAHRHWAPSSRFRVQLRVPADVAMADDGR